MLSRRSLSLFSFVLFILFAMAIVVVSTARAANGGPDTFISKVGQEAINALTAKELSDKERQERFRAILNRAFRLKLIARFTLGRY